MKGELTQDQPFIAADEHLMRLLSVCAPPSVYLLAVPKKAFSDPLERLIAREFLLFGVQGETILVSAAAELLGTDQDSVLDVLARLEKLGLLEVSWLDVTRAGGCLVHVVGTHKLIVELVAARDEIRANREAAVEQLLTLEERARIEEDKRLARQEQSWTLAEPLKTREVADRVTPQDSSKAAIGARARRYAEATRHVKQATAERVAEARGNLAARVRQDAVGKWCFKHQGKQYRYATKEFAVEKLCELTSVSQGSAMFEIQSKMTEINSERLKN